MDCLEKQSNPQTPSSYPQTTLPQGIAEQSSRLGEMAEYNSAPPTEKAPQPCQIQGRALST